MFTNFCLFYLLQTIKRETDQEILEKEKHVIQLEQEIRGRDTKIRHLEDIIANHRQEVWNTSIR